MANTPQNPSLLLRYALGNRWPPVKECPQYKLGMIQAFLTKQSWEDKEHIDDEEFYDHKDVERVTNTFEMVKKFLYQVRTTRGYGVDCRPPSKFTSPFRWLNLENEDIRKVFAKDLNRLQEVVINYINEKVEKTGTTCEFGKVLNLVSGINLVYLMTFTAKVIGTSYERTFIAMVYTPVCNRPFVIKECMLKPEGEAPTHLDDASTPADLGDASTAADLGDAAPAADDPT